MADHSSEHHGDGHYVKIYLILLGLLIVSILGPELEIQLVTLITAFGVAVIKANLVVSHFMHLNVEKPIIKWLLGASVVLMALMWAGIAPWMLRVWLLPAAETDQASSTRGLASSISPLPR